MQRGYCIEIGVLLLSSDVLRWRMGAPGICIGGSNGGRWVSRGEGGRSGAATAVFSSNTRNTASIATPALERRPQSTNLVEKLVKDRHSAADLGAEFVRACIAASVCYARLD